MVWLRFLLPALYVATALFLGLGSPVRGGNGWDLAYRLAWPVSLFCPSVPGLLILGACQYALIGYLLDRALLWAKKKDAGEDDDV